MGENVVIELNRSSRRGAGRCAPNAAAVEDSQEVGAHESGGDDGDGDGKSLENMVAHWYRRLGSEALNHCGCRHEFRGRWA